MNEKRFITREIRDSEGQFTAVSERAMINLGIERMGYCEACGHSIENHYGVKFPTGERYIWVGSECFSTLTAGTKSDKIDIEENKVYTENGKEYINPSDAWLEKVKDYNALSFYPSGQIKGYRNDFVQSIYNQALRYKRLSMKQFNAVNKIVS